MTRKAEDTSVDNVAMLLSTDWFFPYRSLIGIEVESQKDCVQNGCREIVQRFIGSAAEYAIDRAREIDFTTVIFRRNGSRKLVGSCSRWRTSAGSVV
jgi:hypothetical protein